MFNLSNISGLITAVVVLGVLIFVHELGHFLVAKRLKFCVLKFSIGFGKKLFGFIRGETEYVISAIPLGGYVKFYGENAMGEEEDVDVLSEEEKKRAIEVTEDRQFSNIHPAKRILTVLAGPVFNLIFASVLFTIILLNGFIVPSAKIGEALEDHPAYMAGIRSGDVILEVDGNEVKDWEDVHNFITTGKDKLVRLKIDRGGEMLKFAVEPKLKTEENPFGEKITKRLVGIVNSQEPEDAIEKKFSIGESIVMGALQTVDYINITLKGMAMLITRKIPVRENLGGPIMIVQMTGEYAKKGIMHLLNFTAVISISLGIINLMPIPILDGGAVIFFFIELIKGSPISLKKRMAAQQVGLFLLIALMLFAFYNDIARIVSS
jgi:regulator of sigma E protease